mgnify:CR=1 FL=1
MQKPVRRNLWTTVCLLIVAATVVYAQQVNIITRGTGGVGRLVVGVGSDDAVTFANAFVSLTNAQVLALNSTAVTVIDDPGDGYIVDVIDGMLFFDYTAAYTAGGSDDLRLWYTNRTTGPAA